MKNDLAHDMFTFLPRASKHRSRRLRKKMAIDEFQQFGFVVRTDLSDEANRDQVIDQIIELIEHRNLSVAGGGDRNLAFCVYKNRKSATEEDREALEQWLLERTDLKACSVGNLIDINYDIDNDGNLMRDKI